MGCPGVKMASLVGVLEDEVYVLLPCGLTMGTLRGLQIAHVFGRFQNVASETCFKLNCFGFESCLFGLTLFVNKSELSSALVNSLVHTKRLSHSMQGSFCSRSDLK